MNAFQKPALDETLWRSFMASVNHLANVLKPEQVGVAVWQRHRHAASTSAPITWPTGWKNKVNTSLNSTRLKSQYK